MFALMAMFVFLCFLSFLTSLAPGALAAVLPTAAARHSITTSGAAVITPAPSFATISPDRDLRRRQIVGNTCGTSLYADSAITCNTGLCLAATNAVGQAFISCSVGPSPAPFATVAYNYGFWPSAECAAGELCCPENAPSWIFQLFITGATTVTGVECGTSTVTQYFSPYPGIFDDADFGYIAPSTTSPAPSPPSTTSSTTHVSTSPGGGGGSTTDFPPSISSSSTSTTTSSVVPAASNPPSSNSNGPSSDSLQKESNKIALGCGLGIPLAALIVGIATYLKMR